MSRQVCGEGDLSEWLIGFVSIKSKEDAGYPETDIGMISRKVVHDTKWYKNTWIISKLFTYEWKVDNPEGSIICNLVVVFFGMNKTVY